MPAETLGQRIREARLALGLTQEQLAKPEFTKGFISQLEHDQTRPSISTLEHLARKLRRPISYFVEAVDGATTRKVLDSQNSRGRSELARRHFDAALATFTDMRTTASSPSHALMETQATLGVGEALVGLNRFAEARPCLQDAAACGRAAKDALMECRALHGLATIEHRTGQFTQAALLFREALAVVPALGGAEPSLHGEIWLHLGTVLFRMGRLEEAEEAFAKAKRTLEDAKLPDRIGEAFLGSGMVLWRSGDYDGALLQYERARVRFEQYEDLRLLSYVRNNLGVVLMTVGRPHEALEHLSASLAIKRNLHDAVGECRTLTEMARCHFEAGDMAQAREYATLAIAKSREAGAPDEEAQAQIILGMMATADGDLRKARRYLEQAAEHCEQTSMALDLMTVYYALARLAVRQRRYKDAANYYEREVAALRTVGPHDIVRAIHLIDLAEHRAAARAGKAMTPVNEVAIRVGPKTRGGTKE